jgi:hypothetical protein
MIGGYPLIILRKNSEGASWFFGREKSIDRSFFA